MKTLRRIGRVLLGLFFLVTLTVKQIDFSPVQTKTYYQESLAQIKEVNHESVSQFVQVGYGRSSIMPNRDEFTVVGHRKRGKTTTVMDSLAVNVILLNKETIFISYDLIMIVPKFKKEVTFFINEKHPNIKNIYFSTTHTHNGLGGWGDKFLTAFLLGKYDNEQSQHISNQTIKAIVTAHKNTTSASFNYSQKSFPHHISNRIYDDDNVDPYWRSLVFTDSSNQKIILNTYQAHATLVESDTMIISRDYPGMVNDKLEKDTNIIFSMYMAGGVGSHHPHWDNYGIKALKSYTSSIADTLVNTFSNEERKFQNIDFNFHTIKLRLNDPVFRITQKLQLRSWLFSLGLGKEKSVTIDILKINNTYMISTPCDISGEITRELNTQFPNKNIILTSFNGQYIGYITPDHYYIENSYFEMMEMNWYGPGNGQYFYDAISTWLSAEK